jgi:hypothetical protein
MMPTFCIPRIEVRHSTHFLPAFSHCALQAPHTHAPYASCPRRAWRLGTRDLHNSHVILPNLNDDGRNIQQAFLMKTSWVWARSPL